MKYTHEQIEKYISIQSKLPSPCVDVGAGPIVFNLDEMIVQLFTQNERYRDALEKLAVAGEIGEKPNCAVWLNFHCMVAQIARGALGE